MPELADREFHAADGSAQRYVEIAPPGAGPDLLVALHGHGADRWQFARDERDECRAARYMAAHHGMVFVSPDYRAPASWMGPAAEADLLALIAACRERYGVGRLFLIGGSMGGTSGLIFTIRHPQRVAGVIALNPIADMTTFDQPASGINEALRAAYGGTREEIPDAYRARSALHHPEQFTMPVAITTGGQDDVLPPQSAIALAEMLDARGAPVLLIHRQEAGHATNYPDSMAAGEFVLTQAARS